MLFEINIPIKDNNNKIISVNLGESLIFVGANGSGKSKLAAKIEIDQGINAHRISAQRALQLNPDVAKITEEKALNGLRIGYEHQTSINNRVGNRWKQKPTSGLLNDFDYLLQALFANQSKISLNTHNQAHGGNLKNDNLEKTNFQIIQNSWEHLLPTKTLEFQGDTILVKVTGSDAQSFSASSLSDGERAIFYLLGQAVTAAPNSLLIFDEPELHIHPSIMSKLWDEIEAMRPDCAFLFITHDLEFAASRIAQKFVLKEYCNQYNGYWHIEDVPEDTGFDEETTTLILGSRKPILFVEGSENSLDAAIYRSCFPTMTIIPKGSCSEVLHSVVTMRANAQLTRTTCAGIIDSDSYDEATKAYFSAQGVTVLPVSEIENLLLTERIILILAKANEHNDAAAVNILNQIKTDIFKLFDDDKQINDATIRFCKRQVDYRLKKMNIGQIKDIESLEKGYQEGLASINIESLAQDFKNQLQIIVSTQNLDDLLKVYDNKGMLSIAATNISGCRRNSFESWIIRILNNNSVPELKVAIQELLPEFYLR